MALVQAGLGPVSIGNCAADWETIENRDVAKENNEKTYVGVFIIPARLHFSFIQFLSGGRGGVNECTSKLLET